MAPNKDIKILVVDDYPSMRRILLNILKQLGYSNLLEAEDGVSALEKLNTEEIDFVITDWSMPRMNGLELLKAIRGEEKTKNVPVLMVTSEAIRENIIEAVKAGVNNYVMKPIDARTLAEKINIIFS